MVSPFLIMVKPFCEFQFPHFAPKKQVKIGTQPKKQKKTRFSIKRTGHGHVNWWSLRGSNP